MGADPTDYRERARQQALARMKRQGVFQTPTVGSGPGGAPEPLAAAPAPPEGFEPAEAPAPPEGFEPVAAASVTPGAVHQEPLDTSDEPGPRGEPALRPNVGTGGARANQTEGQGQLQALLDRVGLLGANTVAAARDSMGAPSQQDRNSPVAQWVDRARVDADQSGAAHPVMALGGDLLSATLIPTGRLPGVGAAGTRGVAGAAGPISRGTGMAGAVGRYLGPMGGRAAQTIGTGVPLAAGYGYVNERDPARREEAAGSAALGGLGFSAGGALVGEALQGAERPLTDWASRRYGAMVARGAPSLREAYDMGMEQFGDVARNTRAPSGRPIGGLFTPSRDVSQASATAGRDLEQLTAQLPPVDLGPLAGRILRRITALRPRPESAERVGALESAVGTAERPRLISSDMREELTQRIFARRAGRGATSSAAGTPVPGAPDTTVVPSAPGSALATAQRTPGGMARVPVPGSELATRTALGRSEAQAAAGEAPWQAEGVRPVPGPSGRGRAPRGRASPGEIDERPPTARELLQEMDRGGAMTRFRDAHGGRSDLDDRIFGHTSTPGEGPAGQELMGLRHDWATELRNAADRGGRGEDWRRVLENSRVTRIADSGTAEQEMRNLRGLPLGTAGSMSGGSLWRTMAGVAASRVGHRGASTVADMLSAITRTNPRALGIYAEPFIRMRQQHGETGVAAEHYRRSVTDPAYSAATDESDE